MRWIFCIFVNQYLIFKAMDVVELRTDLHNMIDKISDSNILLAVRTLLSGSHIAQADWWETIDESERTEIEQGLKEVESGEAMPHRQVMAKYKKWL